ncbi:MAG: SRPBCC domain-containing protein [Armatimonadetes bacterium]|nr:SRPBCC domain-containing protein [Armatimonadota bacterium]
MSNHKLEFTFPSDTEILMTRKFDFPKDRVYEAFADHETHRHWLGCGMGTCLESYGKPEVGEPWSFKMDMGEMGQFHCFGQCLEAVPNEKFVRTFVYNVPEIREQASVEAATFSEENGTTTLQIRVRHLTKENRDGHFNSGMEQGAVASYDSLEKFLEGSLVN